MNYAIISGTEILRVFRTQQNAELYIEHQDSTEYWRIEPTREPLTQWPADSYYQGW